MAEALGSRLVARSLELGHGKAAETWPSARYQSDPVAFAREVLGVEPWSKQIEILEAVRDHKRVTVRSGHKCGKSLCAAMLALWYYCSFPDARVILSSTTSRQVDAILWREVRKLYIRALRTIDGDMHELARSGLKANDFREIVGFTAREAEAVAGVSGARLLYILDEASGIDDAIFEAIEGNRAAAGTRLVLLSNPTQTEGEFYRSHCDEKTKRFYKAVHVSSEDTPNAREGREVVPALASREWVEEKREEWGEDSPLYKVRVRGEFVLGEDGKILTVHAIAQAEARWLETPAVGRLMVGLDPAGEGDGGDESVWAARRGAKVLELKAARALTPAEHVAHTLDFIRSHREKGELPVLLVDREGEIGARVYAALCGHLELHPHDFELIGVRSSERCVTGAPVDRVRDALWANLRDFLRAGGAIPEDARLAKELHAPSWIPRLGGRDKVTPKTELRKALGRSPDRADAVALAVWEPAILRAELEADPPPAPREERADLDEDVTPDRVFDPYRGSS